MAAIKKVFKEFGLLLGKELKPASKEITIKENGVSKTIEAQPDRYILKICTSGDISEDMGMDTPAYYEFKINSGVDGLATEEDIALFKSLKYLDKVQTLSEMSTAGSFKIVKVLPYSKNK